MYNDLRIDLVTLSKSTAVDSRHGLDNDTPNMVVIMKVTVMMECLYLDMHPSTGPGKTVEYLIIVRGY